MRCPFFVVLLLASLPTRAWAVELCPLIGLAKRTGTAASWVELPVDSKRMISITRSDWISGLRSNHSLCGDWAGRWSASASPVNVPNETKRIRYRFKASEFPRGVSGVWNRLRIRTEMWRERISQRLARTDSTGVWRKLVLNESAASHDGDRLDGGRLRQLGFVHLLSSSGIHLYALASWIDWISRSVCTWISFPVIWGLRLSRFAACATWLAAWLLNGGRPGMLRPLIVVGLRTFARSRGWKWRSFMPLILSVGVDAGIAGVAAMRNSIPWAPGRIHYALAVAGGLMGMRGKNQTDSEDGFFKHLGSHFSLALGSWWLTAVWDVIAEGLVSPLTPVVSLVTIPLFAVIVFPAIIFGNGAGLDRLLQASDWILRTLLQTLERGPSLVFVWPRVECVLLALSLSIVAVSCSKKRPWVGIVLLAMVVILRQVSAGGAGAPLPPVASEVIQLDVGQGDAALVLMNSGYPCAGLIDAGPGRALKGSDWIRLLSHRGIARLDWIALTHLDEDHAGGVMTLIRTMPVGRVVGSKKLWSSERGRTLASTLHDHGVKWVAWDGDPSPDFPFHAIDLTRLGRRKPTGNAIMSGYAIPLVDERWYLGLGDSDASQELRALPWLQSLGVLRQTVFFKISHHGSRFSSSETFLHALRIDEAWISSGVNRYGHPSPLVTESLLRESIRVRRTDEVGMISTSTEGKDEIR